ncbi:MAG TPA: trehalose-phosphatase [Allosphingosinicella sp.]|uniref:trehalose-phosphatase n=1 Tax=Allosphingosinicella sp. TaxID=2823234 RepID=UPI002ED97A84
MSPSKAPPQTLLEGAALFLDFDGTLVELAETPDAIRVDPELPSLLKRVATRLGGRLAIVSGRSIQDLERHMDCAGVAVSGSHGLELRLADGEHIPLSAPVDLNEAREEIRSFAASLHVLLVEEKPRSVALHYRQAPERQKEVEEFMAALAKRSGLTVQAGKMVLELRPKGADKGDAVRALMAEPQFAGARPLFVGDDLTDEDAFEAAAALGGAGILVGPERPSAAVWRLPNVAAVAAWLRGAA